MSPKCFLLSPLNNIPCFHENEDNYVLVIEQNSIEYRVLTKVLVNKNKSLFA